MAYILVLDDEVLIRELLEKFLSIIGYHVHVAQDGMDAIRLLDGDHQYKAVITDVDMQKITGHDIAHYIRNSEEPHLPIVAITGRSESSLESNLFDAVLQKPFKLEQLKNALQKLIPAPRKETLNSK